MPDKIDINSRIQPLQPGGLTPKKSTPGKLNGSTFQEILDKSIGKLQFSKHALERLDKRRLKLSSEDLARLEGAVAKAAAKGAKESLVVLGDVAYVVSIKNNIVITALDGPNMKDNVFTNIDSAVILD